MKKCISLFYLLFHFISFSQENISAESRTLNWAKYYLINNDYVRAEKKFRLLEGEIKFEDFKYLIETYLRLEKNKSAKNVYDNIINTEHADILDYYKYSNLISENLKLSKEYIDKANRLNFFIPSYNDSVNYKLDGIKLNSDKSEFVGGLLRFNDKLRLFYLIEQAEDDTKKLRRRFLLDKSFYNLDQVVVLNPKNFEKDEIDLDLNSNLQEGPIAMDTISQVLFLSKSDETPDEKNVLQINIYYKDLKLENSIIQKLPLNINGYSTLHPSVDNKKNRLYFSSDRPGGFGGMDLYYVPLSEVFNEKIKPINLGPDINSEKNEVFPFSDNFGTLFYSKESERTKRDLDVYFAKNIIANRWKTYMLPKPFNSEEDDFSFVLDYNKKIGFISSNRAIGKGNDDIFVFQFNPSIEGQKDFYNFKYYDTLVVSNNGVLKNDIDSMYRNDILTDLFEKDVRLVDSTKFGHLILNKNGSFLYVPDNKSINKSDSFYYKINSALGDSKKILVELKPEKIKLSNEEIFTLRPIYYDFDVANYDEKFKERLEEVVEVLNNKPELNLKIISSTDCLGTSKYNLELSKKRNEIIINYIRPRIKNKERIIGLYFGESMIPNNSTKNYTVYVGDFKNEEDASKNLIFLEKLNYKPMILKDKKNVKIKIGDFETKKEVNSILKNLKNKGLSPYFDVCDCYKLNNEIHEEQRKTVFEILNQ